MCPTEPNQSSSIESDIIFDSFRHPENLRIPKMFEGCPYVLFRSRESRNQLYLEFCAREYRTVHRVLPTGVGPVQISYFVLRWYKRKKVRVPVYRMYRCLYGTEWASEKPGIGRKCTKNIMNRRLLCHLDLVVLEKKR